MSDNTFGRIVAIIFILLGFSYIIDKPVVGSFFIFLGISFVQILNEKESNGKYFGWLLVIIFGLFGLNNIVDKPVVGLFFIFLSFSFTQIFRTWLKNKTKINISLLYGIFIIVFIIAYNISSAAIKEEKQREAAKRQELIIQEEKQREIIAIKSQTDFFNRHKDDVLNEMKNLQKEKKYSQAIDKASLYIQTQDADLLALKKEIEAVYNEIQKQEALQKSIEDTFYGPRPVSSAWSGTYSAVEDYLERAVRDPDSLKIEGCSDVSKLEAGWAVSCSYRARNGFGGMVRETKMFVIRQNRVIGVI